MNKPEIAAGIGLAGLALFLFLRNGGPGGSGFSLGGDNPPGTVLSGAAVPGNQTTWYQPREPVFTKKEAAISGYAPQPFQISDKIAEAMYLYNSPKGAAGTPLSLNSEYRMVGAAARTGGGVYVTPPTPFGGGPIGNTRGIGIIPITDDASGRLPSSISSKKSATIESTQAYGGTVSGGRVYVQGASSPVSNAPTSRSTFTSSGWVTRY